MCCPAITMWKLFVFYIFVQSALNCYASTCQRHYDFEGDAIIMLLSNNSISNVSFKAIQEVHSESCERLEFRYNCYIQINRGPGDKCWRQHQSPNLSMCVLNHLYYAKKDAVLIAYAFGFVPETLCDEYQCFSNFNNHPYRILENYVRHYVQYLANTLMSQDTQKQIISSVERLLYRLVNVEVCVCTFVFCIFTTLLNAIYGD